MKLVQNGRATTERCRRAALWLLYRSRDVDAAYANYNNRRLSEAAERAGLAASVVHPNDAQRMISATNDLSGPLAVLSRSGTKLGRSGKQVLATAEARGLVVLPELKVLDRAESKFSSALTLATHGVPTPLTLPVTEEATTEWLGDVFGFPLVVKNAMGSKGREVRLCERPEDFAARFAEVSGSGPVLAQRYVRSSHGRDVRVIVVGGEPVAAMVRVAAGGTLCANVHSGASAYPTPITAEMASIAVAASASLGLEIAGVDLLFDECGLVVCEVNTAPGLEMIERVSGRDVAGAMIGHVRNRLLQQASAAPFQLAV